MRIHFVLPGAGWKPVGGYKVAYEYANRLAAMGNQVSVSHAAGLYLGLSRTDHLARNIARYLALPFVKGYLPSRWFDLDRRVKARWVPSLAAAFAPDADVIVATSWETAEWVASYPARKGRKYYLIQHVEDWSGPRDRVLATWKLPLHKIVISRWLRDLASSMGEATSYIPNGLNFDTFGMDVAPEDRAAAKVLMLYHNLEWKGSSEGLAALAAVRERVPDLHVTLFGAALPESSPLPDWATFEYQPTQARLRQLYNEAAIFISPSWAEGWALPPAEAMQCGCATVLTRIGGHEYAVEGATTLLAEPHDIEGMAANILMLIENHDLRLTLAKAGYAEVAQYTWQRAASSLAEVLTAGRADLTGALAA